MFDLVAIRHALSVATSTSLLLAFMALRSQHTFLESSLSCLPFVLELFLEAPSLGTIGKSAFALAASFSLRRCVPGSFSVGEGWLVTQGKTTP